MWLASVLQSEVSGDKIGKEWSEDFPGTQEGFLPLAVILATGIMLLVPGFPILKLEWESVNEQCLLFWLCGHMPVS